jgi:hypothetical protein
VGSWVFFFSWLINNFSQRREGAKVEIVNCCRLNLKLLNGNEKGIVGSLTFVFEIGLRD